MDIVMTLLSVAYQDLEIAHEWELHAFGIRRRALDKERNGCA